MNTLNKAIQIFPQTQVWNDSCCVDELDQCIKDGGSGATTNPVIVFQVLQKELPYWEPIIHETLLEHPDWSEDALAWYLIQQMGKRGAKHLLPLYHESNGNKGRLSLQTNSKFYNNSTALIDHACDLANTMENVQIKAPASKAGIEAFETLTYMGISINATVCFSVAQAIAVAEAVERGLERRTRDGLSNAYIFPVCTIMAGRLDDYLKIEADQLNLKLDPTILDQAGIAVVKKTYTLFKAQNYKTKVLVAAYRTLDHWYSTLGADLIHTLPATWQDKIRMSNLEILSQIEIPVPQNTLEQLNQLPGFIQAYEKNGMEPTNFQHYGAFVITMKQFLSGYDTLVAFLRNYMVK